jgi:acyl-CoA synthetase (AMP-forming)/AMP-acid ligase II
VLPLAHPKLKEELWRVHGLRHGAVYNLKRLNVPSEKGAALLCMSVYMWENVYGLEDAEESGEVLLPDVVGSSASVLAAGAAYVPVDADDPQERAELVFGEAEVAGVITEAGLSRGKGSSRGWNAAAPAVSDDAWIIFTSGSTGVPKGVAVTHRNAAAFIDAEARLWLDGEDLVSEAPLESRCLGPVC